MTLPTQITVPVRKAWAWLLADYHWLWLVLLPLGVLYAIMKFMEPKLEVVGSAQAGADAKRAEVLAELELKDTEAREERGHVVAGAEQAHSAAVATQVAEQTSNVPTYAENPDELTSAMLRAGKEARQ